MEMEEQLYSKLQIGDQKVLKQYRVDVFMCYPHYRLHATSSDFLRYKRPLESGKKRKRHSDAFGSQN